MHVCIVTLLIISYYGILGETKTGFADAMVFWALQARILLVLLLLSLVLLLLISPPDPSSPSPLPALQSILAASAALGTAHLQNFLSGVVPPRTPAYDALKGNPEDVSLAPRSGSSTSAQGPRADTRGSREGEDGPLRKRGRPVKAKEENEMKAKDEKGALGETRAAAPIGLSSSSAVGINKGTEDIDSAAPVDSSVQEGVLFMDPEAETVRVNVVEDAGQISLQHVAPEGLVEESLRGPGIADDGPSSSLEASEGASWIELDRNERVV